MAAPKIPFSKGSSKNDEYARLARRKVIAELYLQGKPQFEIGMDERVNLSQPNVHRELGIIRAEWLSSAVRDFDEAKAQELAKIDRLEEVAWDAFARSCRNAVSKEVKKGLKTVRKKGSDGKERMSQELGPVEEKRVSRGQAGDPRFLERVAWCIDYRCKILGIHKDAPANVNNLIINFDQLYGKPEMGDDPVERRIVEASRPVLTAPATNGTTKKGK